MRTVQSLRDRIYDKDGVSVPVLAVAFHPTAPTLFAAAGSQILLYDTTDASLRQTLKGHKDNVYCLDVASDGQRLVSGGKDKTVIIWNEQFEPILRYSHADSVQTLAINAVSGAVCSGTQSDFGLWSAEQKNVIKYKVHAKINSCAWTRDGQYMALGHMDGVVSIRDKNGDEKARVERGHDSPVWSVCWNPSRERHSDVLAVADWGQRLSFYQPNGTQVGREKLLEYDPCALAYVHNGQYLVMGGSDGRLTMWTSDGVGLGLVGECQDSWIWTAAMHPRLNLVAFGSEDGTVCMQQVVFNTVHALYRDRYAFRENMTDVVVQHLTLNMRVRIRCRDYVKKVALYKNMLAVQLPERVIIYQFQTSEASEMHFQVKEQINKKVDSNLLVVTAQHILLCVDHTLRLFNFRGDPEREWVLDASVRYIKVTGGPVGREGILVGTKDGRVLQIFVDNPFSVELVKQAAPIRCVDLSRSRTKLAVIDDASVLSVYEIRNGGSGGKGGNNNQCVLLYQEPNATSVAWNTDHDDMVCFSGNGVLSIRVGNLPTYQQQQPGFVVGFTGSKIFALHMYSMTMVDVSHASTVERLLDRKEYARAYQAACLGITEAEWQAFAARCLEGLQLVYARKAYVRLRDVRGLDFVEVLGRLTERDHVPAAEALAEIYAFLGRYTEAATQYKSIGRAQRAIDMYSELNMWEYATRIAVETNTNVEDVLKRKAQMQQDKNDLRAAAETYLQVGDTPHAIELLGQVGDLDRLVEVARTLPNSDTKLLQQCAAVFRKHGHTEYTTEMLRKLDDKPALARLLVEQQAWKEAFTLCDSSPEICGPIVYLPYANWLVTQDRFVEAQAYYRRGGDADQSRKVAEQLIYNAIEEERFSDAGHLYWMCGQQCLQSISHKTPVTQLSKQELRMLQQYEQCMELANLYYAYHPLHRYMEEPFTSHPLQHLFNMARFILSYANGGITQGRPLPDGISRVYVLYALAKTAQGLGAYATAASAFNQLQHTCYIPSEWAGIIDMATLLARGQLAKQQRLLQSQGAASDDRAVDELSSALLLPICFACSATNPLLSTTGDRCVQCGERFVHSLYSFEYLPLVEFALENGISDADVSRVLGTRAHEHQSGAAAMDHDPFLAMLATSTATTTNPQQPDVGLGSACVQVSQQLLAEMEASEVFIVRSTHACVPTRYFKLILNDVMLTVCTHCQRFFQSEEYEEAVVQSSQCPFCRTRVELGVDDHGGDISSSAG
ncbi:hypothetical protein RI367_000379 [Sorochytrium milnesiophthora]